MGEIKDLRTGILADRLVRTYVPPVHLSLRLFYSPHYYLVEIENEIKNENETETPGQSTHIGTERRPAIPHHHLKNPILLEGSLLITWKRRHPVAIGTFLAYREIVPVLDDRFNHIFCLFSDSFSHIEILFLLPSSPHHLS